MTIVDDALPILWEGRAILDQVGLRNFRVSVRITDWTGGRGVGIGTSTVTEYPLTEAGGARPKVVAVSPASIVASGGELGDVMYDVTLTPAFTGGGTTVAEMTPPAATGNATKREVHYLVFGPGCAEAGTICVQVSENHTSPFRHVMRLKKTGAT